MDSELQELRRRLAESPQNDAARERLASLLERQGDLLEMVLVTLSARVHGTLDDLRGGKPILVSGPESVRRLRCVPGHRPRG